MSIISKAPFQDIGFGYIAPPFVGSNDFWFPHTWFPEFVPMLLDQASAHFRHIAMFSHNNSNLSLVPVFNDDQVVADDLKRYSFTTGSLYGERIAISVLLETLITDGGRYTKYHPNVMLALFASHGDAQSGHVSSGGVAESKCDEFKVVAGTSTTPAENAFIRSGAVTAEELRLYADEHRNRQPFTKTVSAPFHECRRRPESDPCGLQLQQVSQHVCCDICLFSDGRQHTATCDFVNLATTALALAPTPPSGGNGGNNAGGSAAPGVDDDWRPGWHNYSASTSCNSDGFATGRQHDTVNNPAASLGDRGRSAPLPQRKARLGQCWFNMTLNRP